MIRDGMLFTLAMAATVCVCCDAPDGHVESDGPVAIERFPTGLFGSNSYVVSSRGEGIIVDAGVNDEALFRYVESQRLDIRYIFITHSHVDHLVWGNLLKRRTGAALAMHQAELAHFAYYTPARIDELLATGQMQAHQLPMLREYLNTAIDLPLHGGERLSLPGLSIEVLPTPGHSRGSVCLFVNRRYLFSGDTLFRQNIGRTDLDSGNADELRRTLQGPLFDLADDVTVYPGHRDADSMGAVKLWLRAHGLGRRSELSPRWSLDPKTTDR